MEEKKEKIENCPECNTKLKTDTIVRVIGNDKIKIMDYYQFCPNMKCDFEQDIKKKKLEN